MTEHDRIMSLRFAERKGREEGLAEGMEKGLIEGRAEGIKTVAKNLKATGHPINTIVQATGLSKEQVEDL